MLVPTNAPAETIVKMQQENFGYESQIESLSSFLENNNRLIEELEPLATWEKVEDVEEPDTDPEEGLAPPVEPPPSELPAGMVSATMES
jgi:hypothetical protein